MVFQQSKWRHGFCVASVAAVAFLALASPGHTATDDEAAFIALNNAAMNRMMTAMDVRPSGDVDRDFVAMMVPHHEGAVDMALAELQYGKDERLRRIAQEIIVTQRQEIDVMRLAVSSSAPPTPAAHHDMHDMTGDKQ